MRVLLIKTSSMGDVIHTLPALTDAGKALPRVTFDWVVEETFAEIPEWHPLVQNVIPVALRRWRKALFARQTRAEWQQFRKRVRENTYDLILDAQGLMKSAFLTVFARGERVGFDWSSVREPLASLAYQRKCSVNVNQHAISRIRSLFGQALGYALPDTVAAYGLDRQLFQQASSENYLVFLHGTTWTTKQWPEEYWIALAKYAEQAGYRVKLGGGNAEEIARAKRIATHSQAVDVVPSFDIASAAKLISRAQGVVAVDTGFTHLAAALNIPTVSLYGPTDPALTGALGQSQIHLAARFSCAPCLSRICTYREKLAVTPACFSTLTPMRVWRALESILR